MRSLEWCTRAHQSATASPFTYCNDDGDVDAGSDDDTSDDEEEDEAATAAADAKC